MEKVAKLVEVSFTSRIIVNKNATDDETIRLAKENILERIHFEIAGSVTIVSDDVECPFGTFDTDHIG